MRFLLLIFLMLLEISPSIGAPITYNFSGNSRFESLATANDFGLGQIQSTFTAKVSLDDEWDASDALALSTEDSQNRLSEEAFYGFLGLEFTLGNQTWNYTDGQGLMRVVDGIEARDANAFDRLMVSTSNDISLPNGVTITALTFSTSSIVESIFGRSLSDPVYSGVDASNLSFWNFVSIAQSSGSLSLSDNSGNHTVFLSNVEFVIDPILVDVNEPPLFAAFTISILLLVTVRRQSRFVFNLK